MADDDRTLLARFATAADQAAFAQLVDRHGSLVWGVCRRAVASDSLAEDAFQAVFVLLARKAATLELRTSLANWLFGVAARVARRAARNELRLKNREQIAVRRANRHERREETGSAEWHDLLRVLDEELAGIAEKYRGPLVACYLQGKTQDEAAADLGISIFKLRRRLAKARDLLRFRLTRRGVTFAGTLFAGAVVANVGFAATLPTTAATLAVKSALAVQAGGALAPGVANLLGTSSAGAWAVGAVLAVGLTLLVVVGNWPPANPSAEPREVAPGPRLLSPEPPGQWVQLRGRVVWPGELPKPRFAEVTSDVASCCQNGPLPDTALLVDADTRGVKNVVVWLRPDTDDRRDTFPPDRAHPAFKIPVPTVHSIDQPHCQFEPRVVVAREGDVLAFKNSATIAHNVHIVSDYHDLNQTIPSGGNYRVTRPLVAEPLPMIVKCDVHPWMSGRVRVFDHPYFALTASNGEFKFNRVPVGRWRLVYWHEFGFHQGRAGALGFPVNVTADATLPALEFQLPTREKIESR